MIPCIIVHADINTLGTFVNDTNLIMEKQLLHLGILIFVTVAYTLFLTKTLPKNNGDSQTEGKNLQNDRASY